MTQSKESIKEDVLFLLLKIAVFIILLVIMFLFVFGIYRCGDDMMSPAFKNGDLAIYYRLQKEYQSSDTVVLEKEGELQIRRIVAASGDVIEMTTEGLKINGYLQQEPEIGMETLPYTEGISYPLTLGEDEYFVLGDHRIDAKDSRLYGTVSEQEIKGTVITLLRHRDF